MIAEITITYFLKDGTSNSVSISADFSDDVKRGKLVSIMMKLIKGGYTSLIQVSKIIAQKSEGNILINPIHINTVDISCSFNNSNPTLKRLMDIASDCDMRKFQGIDWVNLRQNKSI